MTASALNLIQDEVSDLAALKRLLSLSEGFSIVLVQCDSIERVLELVAEMRDGLPAVREMDLRGRHDVILLDEMRQAPEAEPGTVWFVFGLESSISGAKGARSIAIAALNAARDSFPGVANGPLVLFLPGYAVTALMQGAPDFVSARSGHFVFSGRAVSAPSEWTSNDALTEFFRWSREELEEEEVRLRRIVDSVVRGTGPELSTRAPILARLSLIATALGRPADALGAMEAAVADYRELAANQPGAFRAALAGALINLTGALADAGLSERALAASQEAITFLRDLDVATAGNHRVDLARCLNNISAVFTTLGRRDEAVAAAEESVRLRRKLDEVRPDAFRADLAGSLNNLSNALSNSGRWDEALAAIEEAVELRRELAALRPDAFGPDLASSRTNLSLTLSHLGRREEALATIEEAVSAYRELAARKPDAFRTRLATSLGAYGMVLGEVGHWHESAEAYRDGLVTIAPLYRKLPGAHGELVRGLFKGYTEACQAAGIAPDLVGLEDIVADFAADPTVQGAEGSRRSDVIGHPRPRRGATP